MPAQLNVPDRTMFPIKASGTVVALPFLPTSPGAEDNFPQSLVRYLCYPWLHDGWAAMAMSIGWLSKSLVICHPNRSTGIRCGQPPLVRAMI